MRCPYCKANNDRVVDSRTSGEADVIRRRRECLECGGRFTTYEKAGEATLRVVKKDGTRVPFDRDKLLSGLLVACHKRPVETEVLEGIVTDIESHLHEMFDKEVASKFIGHLVMDALRKIDQAARGIDYREAEENPATAHLFIINPLHAKAMDNLFSTHPATANRIEALEAMAGLVHADAKAARHSAQATIRRPGAASRPTVQSRAPSGGQVRRRGPWG